MNTATLFLAIARRMNRRDLHRIEQALMEQLRENVTTGAEDPETEARIQRMAREAVEDMPDHERQEIEQLIHQAAGTEALEEAARVLADFPGFLAETQEGDPWIERKQSVLRWVTAGKK